MEALIIIDMQKGFFKNILGKRNNLQAENNILRILKNFRKENKEIIHIQHLSTDEKGILFSNEDREFLKSLEPLPNETIFQKIADYFSDKLLSADEIHKYHISALNEEFCEILSTKKFLNL